MKSKTWLWLLGGGVVVGGVAALAGGGKKSGFSGGVVKPATMGPVADGEGAPSPVNTKGPVSGGAGGEGPSAQYVPGWKSREYVTWAKFKSYDGEEEGDPAVHAALNLVGEAGSVIAPWAKPLIDSGVEVWKQALAKIGNREWCSTDSVGEFQVIDIVDQVPADVEVELEWGWVVDDQKMGPVARRAWRGARASTGDLPMVGDAGPPPPSGMGKVPHASEEKSYYARYGIPDFVCRWVTPIGPLAPNVGVSIVNGQTIVILWIPPRATGTQDKLYWDVRYRIR